jgi:NAD(P)-dependent dehydrogenase (short-subunit alcohol dehydrogenase family)
MTAVDLTGSVAVVTGGANGIGLACAERFAQAGASVVLADRDDAALADACERYAAIGVDVTGAHCDVTSDDDIRHLHDVAAAMGPIGMLMLNAGVSAGGRLEVIPISEWQRLFDVNVHGVVRGLNTFVPTLVAAARPARIVVTGSSASFDVDERGANAPYAASKHALVGVVRAYDNYLRPHDISAHLLAPRLTDTAFPRSSNVWGHRGLTTSHDRVVDGADTVDDVAAALMTGLADDRTIITVGG